MNPSTQQILFLKLPGDDQGFGRQLADTLAARQVDHQIIELGEHSYEAVLDCLATDNVVPVVLKSTP